MAYTEKMSQMLALMDSSDKGQRNETTRKEYELAHVFNHLGPDGLLQLIGHEATNTEGTVILVTEPKVKYGNTIDILYKLPITDENSKQRNLSLNATVYFGPDKQPLVKHFDYTNYTQGLICIDTNQFGPKIQGKTVVIEESSGAKVFVFVQKR